MLLLSNDGNFVSSLMIYQRNITTLMKNLFAALVLVIGCTLSAAAQQKLPTTHILLFKMQQINDSAYFFNNPRYLTDFNKYGYNNQPHFMTDDELYITVQMSNDTSQTDIYSLNVTEETLTRVTKTAESEFSPTLVPVYDDDATSASFSCVRVEQDAARSQRLWEFPLDRSNRGTPAFKTIRGVGYYQWINSQKAALFILGAPHQLVVADTRSEQAVNVVNNIGRSLQKVGRSEVAYVDKTNAQQWMIRKLDIRFYRTEEVIPTLPGSEDFVVLPDGTYLMGSYNKLFKFHPKKDNGWLEIADFSYYGYDKITRLAVADTKIAIVFQ